MPLPRLRLTALLFTGACVAAPLDDADPLALVPEAVRAKAPEAMLRALAAGEPRSIIVALLAPAPSPLDEASVAHRLRARDWNAHKRRLLSELPVAEMALEREWEELPLMFVRATTLEATIALLGQDDVERAYDVEELHTFDAESFPLIDQPAALAGGFDGHGTAVAILDTGADYTRAAFGACTAPGVPAATCKVAWAQDFAPSDGQLDDNGHGTNVAGIALGVAPGARILALDVFSGSGAPSNVIIDAINWTVSTRATYNTAAINLSLGGGRATTPCSTDAIGSAIAAARAAGILAAVASGNAGWSDAIASPACAPSAVSVGAVYDSNVGAVSYSMCSERSTAADQIACFSNSAAFLTVLAPGAFITAAGYTMAGTSQATPHVAGALAVLRAAHPSETPDQLVARLTATGKRVRDARNGVSKARIDVAAAVAIDTTPPTGSVSINGGAKSTRTSAVTLAIAASDPSGVAQMCVSNSGSCSSFEAYAASKAWTLSAGDGNKTVTVFLRDKAGNTTSAAASPRASVVLDTTPPSNGALAVAAGNAQVALSWSGFADGGSGLASYRVVAASGATVPAAGCSGSAVYSGSGASFTHVGLTNGAAYSYRVCAVDGAGNVSSGVSASASPRPESSPPVGSLVINGGAAYARATAVTLTLTASDASGVAQMCVSEGASCTSWVAYAASRVYTFAAGDGKRTLNAWFRDPWGNTSAPVSASIVLDTLAPSGATLSASPVSVQIWLAWSGASDATSGVAGYRLVGALGAVAPASCGAGAPLYSGGGRSFVHAVGARTTWSYRLCAVDGAGNVSAGATATATAR